MLRLWRCYVLGVALALGWASSSGRAQAPAPAAFHGIGDFPGGPVASLVTDATSVGGTIYAVGAASKNVVADTQILWDSFSGSLIELPNTVTPVMPPFPPGYVGFYAAAITPDAAYIAGQAHNSPSNPVATTAVRVTRTPLMNTFLDQLGGVNNFAGNALSISNDGSILYGTTLAPSGGVPDGVTRTIRLDIAGSSATIIPPLPGMTQNAPQSRGASSDGSVVVGTSRNVAGLVNGRAFRYVHGSPGAVAAIPLLTGGTWNAALEVSPNGNLALVAGNSPAFPNGEIYLFNAQTSELAALGSPNSAWTPAGFAGMSADGGVVVMTFNPPASLGPIGYLRNRRGWFSLASVVAAQGLDLVAAGWDINRLNISGLSVVDGKDLVFGGASRYGGTEGFVAAFPAGFLAAWTPSKGDFNGDHRSDVLLRNKSTGQNIGWLMNGLTVSTPAFLPTIPDTNWEIKSTGDFDGDGKADVLLRNKSTGQNIGWLMNGLSVSTSAFMPTIADTNWEMRGVGDFDGDGKADVILRNRSTGQNIGWLMNGLTVALAAFMPTIVDTNWEIVGVGDFNGDGKADVILRNKSTGQNIGWLMNALTVSIAAFLPTIADTNWEIKGVGDFNGDGKADVVLRNKASGQNIGWLMNGLTVSTSAFLPTIADTNWDIKGIGDVDSEGKADVILRNTVTGQNIGWLMNGLTFGTAAFLPTIADTNWEIVGP